MGKLVHKNVQEKREETRVDEGGEGKIISTKPEEIYKNLDKLKGVEDRMICALYTLFPARRLNYKNMLIDINNLILSNPKQFFF